MTEFQPGRDLSRSFYQEVLASLVEVPHAAALLGSGSDVLGYDTPRSTDHDWGPRGLLLVAPTLVIEVSERVAAGLPETFRGWPLSIGRNGVAFGPQVQVDSLDRWTIDRLGVDPQISAMSASDWLSIPHQRILEVVSGDVFHDDSGDLTRLRAELHWYPHDVWWWMLGAQWHRLAQEEPFVQRTAEVGDDLGSAVVASRLVRDSMRLALLVGRRYAPYAKWLGTAFSRLADPEGLGRRLTLVVSGTSLREREEALGTAFQILATRFNALAADLDLDPSLRSFHDRPARVLGADRFAEASLARVKNRRLLDLPPIGSIDQVVDNVDVLTSTDLVRRLRPLWSPASEDRGG